MITGELVVVGDSVLYGVNMGFFVFGLHCGSRDPGAHRDAGTFANAFEALYVVISGMYLKVVVISAPVSVVVGTYNLIGKLGANVVVDGTSRSCVVVGTL